MGKNVRFLKMLLCLSGICALSACAGRQYVDDQVNKTVSADMSTMRTEMEDMREDIEKLKNHTKEQETRLTGVEEAIGRAKTGRKAKGKLMFEMTISDESVPFGFNESTLSKDAQSELDIFAEVIISDNKDVYIEIQGHTDNVGSEAYNLKLGEARAEAVRAYLYNKHGIPLLRMSTFSYGESKPAADNNSPANRAKNRRVVLVVME
jgi:outer membrane protein OmpA-like peptidoglycan-associated protein